MACRAPREDAEPLVYDARGQPDCEASYTDVSVCAAIRPFKSSMPEGYSDGWTNRPVRWIGTEADAYYCAESAEEAEAWVLRREADPQGGGHRLVSTDDRWFDIHRIDASGSVTQVHRVLRCSFLSELGPTPPGFEPIESFARYGTVPVTDEADFFPVFREMIWRRAQNLPVQVLLAWGESTTETLDLRTCGVRCGTCEDPGGGNWRQVTGILEQINISLNPDDGTVRYGIESQLQVDCYATW